MEEYFYSCHGRQEEVSHCQRPSCPAVITPAEMINETRWESVQPEKICVCAQGQIHMYKCVQHAGFVFTRRVAILMNGFYNLLWCEMKLMGFSPAWPQSDCPVRISQLQLAAATRKEVGGGNNTKRALYYP